jgi:outer membrane receptor protein involved in Fe transport
MRFFFTPSRFLASSGIFLAASAFLYPFASLAQRTSTELVASPAIVPEKAPTLEEVVVTGQSAVEGTAYAAQESRTATKTRTLLLETPQAVSVITRKLIKTKESKDLNYYQGALDVNFPANKDARGRSPR